MSASVTPLSRMPRTLLNLEGVILFTGAVLVYAAQGGNLLLFLALILAPDLSMIGYRANPQIGSVVYNSVHNYLLPALLLGICWVASVPPGIEVALIWFAHIGMDRALGFGLKYPTEFKDTHLQHV